MSKGKQQAAADKGLGRSKRAKEARGGVEVAGKAGKALASAVGAVKAVNKATAAAGRGMVSGAGVAAGGGGLGPRAGSKKVKSKSAVKRAARVAVAQ